MKTIIRLSTSILLAVASATCFAPHAAAGSLRAHWDFNDVADSAHTTDLVNGVVGDLLGGAAISADGGGASGQPGDRCLDLGADELPTVVYVSDATCFNDAGAVDKLTVAFWQQLYSVVPSYTFWADSPSSIPVEHGVSVHTPWSDNVIYFDTAGCCDPYTQRIQHSMTDFNPGFNWMQWHHFTFVKDGASKQIWVDGVLFHQETNTDPLPQDFTSFRIGAATDYSLHLRGKLDDFAVWNRALTPDQIARLALGASPESLEDADGDGIADSDDACPHSNLSATVVIDGCDSGVPNVLLPGGCTIADRIAICAAGAKNHGAFVSCVAALTNNLRDQGVLSGSQKSRIQRCAAQAKIP